MNFQYYDKIVLKSHNVIEYEKKNEFEDYIMKQIRNQIINK